MNTVVDRKPGLVDCAALALCVIAVVALVASPIYVFIPLSLLTIGLAIRFHTLFPMHRAWSNAATVLVALATVARFLCALRTGAPFSTSNLWHIRPSFSPCAPCISDVWGELPLQESS